MAREEPVLASASTSQPVAGRKRARGEKTKEEQPKKRVKANVPPVPPAETAVDAPAAPKKSAAATSSNEESPKRGRGRPKKATADPPNGASPALPTATVPSEESPKKRGRTKIDKKAIALSRPKWKAVPPRVHIRPLANRGPAPQPRQSTTPPKPRIWATSREELLATLPEMAGTKCFNGLSWEFYENPMLLLDEKNVNVFEVQKEGLDEYSLDLVTTRSFVCPRPMETISQEPEAPSIAVANSTSPIIKTEPLQTGLTGAFTAPPQKPPPKVRKAPRYNLPKGTKAAFADREITDIQMGALGDGGRVETGSSFSKIEFAAPSLPMDFASAGVADAENRAALHSDLPQVSEMPSQPLGADGGGKPGKKKGKTKSRVTTSKNPAPAVNATGDKPSASAPVANSQQLNATRPMPPSSHPQGYASPATTFSNPPPMVKAVAEKKHLTPSTPSSYAVNSNSTSMPQLPSPQPSFPSLNLPSYPFHNLSPPSHPRISSKSNGDDSNGDHLRIVHSPSPTAIPKMKFADPESIGKLLDRAERKFLPRTDGPAVPPPNVPGLMETQNLRFKDGSTRSALLLPPFPTSHEMDVELDPPPHFSGNTSGAALIGQAKMTPSGQPRSSEADATESSGAIPKHVPPDSRMDKISLAARDIISRALVGQSQFSKPPSALERISKAEQSEVLMPTDLSAVPATTEASSSQAMADCPRNTMVACASTFFGPGPAREVEAVGPNMFHDHFADYIPTPIPEELQALVDSYLFGRPLTMILSRGLLENIWALQVPEEMGYVMMGYFRILGVQEGRVRLEEKGKPLSDFWVSGQVEWRFRLRWAPGGEEFIMPNLSAGILEDPWWRPPFKPQPPVYSISQNAWNAQQPEVPPKVFNFHSATQQLKEPEDHFHTTPKYRQARVSHHEYKFRHHPFRELYESLLPTHFLIPFGKRVRDLSFPRGWLCNVCGKNKTTAEPYALSLFTMRDPQDRLPVSFPYNTSPSIIRPGIANYEDGTRTVTYELREDLSLRPYIKHIFKCNYPPLQDAADKLLEGIQLGVELVRGFGDNSPYFYYSASCPKELSGSSLASDWKNVPRVVNDAKAHIYDEARKFDVKPLESLSISQLKIISWVTAGTRKSTGAEMFAAKKHPVMVLCLGCEVALSLYPKSVELLPSKRRTVAEGDYDAWFHLPVSSTAEAHPAEDEAEPEEEVLPGALLNTPDSNAREAPKGPVQKSKTSKKDRATFVLKLIHGDTAVLFGDDFDYSIKRDGTAIRNYSVFL